LILNKRKTHDKLDMSKNYGMVVRPFMGAKGGWDDGFKDEKGTSDLTIGMKIWRKGRKNARKKTDFNIRI